MENRWSVRTPLTSMVTLYHNKIPVAVCTAQDIGLGGIFINTGPITYPLNTPIDIEFELGRHDNHKWYRLPACVVHGAKDGMGLMFLEPNSEIKRIIRRMILDDALHNEPTKTNYDNSLKTNTASM